MASTHPAYLLARLNAKSMRYDGVGGGRGDLSPQDIAAALSFVKPGLGRELLEHVWWPDGSRRRKFVLNDLLTDLQFSEYSRLEVAMYAALAGVAVGPTGEERKRAHAAYAKAHACRWPSWIKRLEPLELSEGYGLIRLAALEELSKPRSCSECDGRGEVPKRELIVICARCKGAGRLPYGPTWRAAQLKMKEPSFKKTWERPYEWLFNRMADALAQASDDLVDAVQ